MVLKIPLGRVGIHPHPADIVRKDKGVALKSAGVCAYELCKAFWLSGFPEHCCIDTSAVILCVPSQGGEVKQPFIG